MSSLSQPKLPFPQRKKVSILKTTKDKVTNLLSNDKKTKNTVLLANEQILRVPSLGTSSPRMTRSTSELPQTPRSQRSVQCPKTPSTLLNELNINSPKTPSSLLRSLKIDSPKRKMNTALDFTSPKRMFKEYDSVSVRSKSSPRLDGRSSRSIKLFHDSEEVTESRSDRKQSPFKRTEILNSTRSECTGISPLKRSERIANSPLKKTPGDIQLVVINSPDKVNVSERSERLKNSPLKRSERLNDSPLKRSVRRIGSPAKKLSSVRMKTAADIENELFDSDLEESPVKNSPYKSPRKKSNKMSSKNSVSSLISKVSEKLIDSPTKKLSSVTMKMTCDIENVLFESGIENSSAKNNPYNSPEKKINKTPLKKFVASPRRDRFNLENSPVIKSRSPLKTEEDYLKPLSPIKNIILGKKSPFKAFIRDDDFKSPTKLMRSPRKQLFQSDENTKVEEKTRDTCELPGREAQLDTIRQFLLQHLNNETSGSMYISGPPGTGKSASLNVILNEDEIKGAFTRIYINCNSVRNASSVYETIVSGLKLKAGGKSERHQLAAILKFFQTKHKSILLILDEIDALESRKQTILYSIFEWPAITGSKLVLIGVANALDLTDRMLPRLQANVKLQPTLMNFAPYSKHQILDIISHKLKKTDKFNMFNAPALQLLAAKVAAVSGDIRKAIDITNHLIDLTYDNIKENGEVAGIGLKDVLDVISSVYCTSQSLNCTKDQDSFPLQQKLALASLLLLKSKPNVKDVTLGKLHEVYRKVCTQRNLQPLDMSEFISAASLLDARGVIKVCGKTKNRMSKVTLQWDEQDITEALRDKQLVSTILNDTSCL